MKRRQVRSLDRSERHDLAGNVHLFLPISTAANPDCVCFRCLVSRAAPNPQRPNAFPLSSRKT